jgi:hypothetical protein
VSARLEWKDGSLLLGGLAMYVNITEENGRWEAYGDASYGPLLTISWEREQDARQDILANVRAHLFASGVVVE